MPPSSTGPFSALEREGWASLQVRGSLAKQSGFGASRWNSVRQGVRMPIWKAVGGKGLREGGRKGGGGLEAPFFRPAWIASSADAVGCSSADDVPDASLPLMLCSSADV